MVSVVIPLYNSEVYIGRCLDSVLSQSYNDIEIVVVDDCSTDGSVAVVEQYCGQHSNIRLVKHERNLGPMMARREGCMAAAGDFIMFVDSDDLLLPSAVENMVGLQMETDADIVMADAQKHCFDGHIERVVGGFAHEAEKLEILSALIDWRVAHCLWGKLFRTSLFNDGSLQESAGMFLAEDGCLLWQLVAKAEKIASFDGIVYEYFPRRGSLSVRAYGVKEMKSIIAAYKMIARECEPYAELHDKIQYRLSRVLFSLYFERESVRTVRALLSGQGMERYGKLKYVSKYLKPQDYWFFVKRFFYVRTVLRRYWHK